MFLRAIAGLWPHGTGRVELPRSRLMFVPQESYLSLGTLKAALCYPQPSDAVNDDLCRIALNLCGLGLQSEALAIESNWAKRLSPGERQRLAFARVLLYRPDFLFLDEATSSLNEDAERALFSLLLEELPDTAVVNVTHRETPLLSFQRVLKICPANRDFHIPILSP
jgi:putative ATP-binding cassette transporter